MTSTTTRDRDVTPADDGTSIRRAWVRRVTVRTTLAHPVARVFPYLEDPMRWHEFAPAVAFRRPMGPDPVRIGSRWMSTDRIGPFRIHFVDELAELEPNRRVVWLSSAPWNARVEYACTEEGGRTRIHATYEGELGGSLRWMLGWMPSWVTHWILARDFRRLERLLTRQARAARRWQQRHPWPAIEEVASGRMLADERTSASGA